MLNRPEFKSCYQVEVVDDQNVFLLAERGHHLLTGAVYGVLARLLDGSRSIAEVVSAAAEQVSPVEIHYALQRLESLGYIRESLGVLPRPVAAFWDSLGADAAAAWQRTRELKVALLTLGGMATGPLAAALADLGVTVAGEGDLTIVLTEDYLNPELADVNERCLREGRLWLLAKTVGSTLWIGPLLRPGRTGCWECLAHRLRNSRHVETYVRARRGSFPSSSLAPISALPSTEAGAAGLLATEVAKWIAQTPGTQLEGTLLTFDLATFTSARHALVRRPQCPVCGDGQSWSQRTPAPVQLERRLKTFAAETGHRALSPEETLKRYEHHISPLIGVVSYLERATGIDSGAVPLYFSGQNSAIKDGSLYFLRNNFRARCGGKGKTEAQARASALCEAIERYSGVFQGDEIRTRGSYRDLEAAIHPNACMNFSRAQYAGRREWNASHHKPFHKVPEPFDEQAEIEWTPLWSLSEEKFKLLPTAYCYFGYPLPAEKRFCWPDSNGSAAGNSLEEAILQGFLELVERDCVALWWYNQLQRPAVDLDSFDEPYFRELRSYYRSLRREVWVVDITSDLGIPAFAAMTRRTDTTPEDITYGFAAHFDARIGVLRALAEANQSLPIVLPRHADPAARYQFDDEEAHVWLRTSTLENRPYLAASAAAPKRAEDYPQPPQGDLKEEVQACVRIAAEHGLETLVLDQTRPDVGLAVAKVVVPGLRQFWPRFGPGRLYDVPVALGWLSAPLDEGKFNPLSIFF